MTVQVKQEMVDEVMTKWGEQETMGGHDTIVRGGEQTIRVNVAFRD